MPEQSIVHQADIYSRSNDGIYLPRVHINRIKRYEKSIVPKQPATHTIKPASRHHHHHLFFIALQSISAPVFYPSLSPACFLPFCLLQIVHCVWLMFGRHNAAATYRPCGLVSTMKPKEKVQLQRWAATHRHPHIYNSDALIWHWIITRLDLCDISRPIKPFICMLTS